MRRQSDASLTGLICLSMSPQVWAPGSRGRALGQVLLPGFHLKRFERRAEERLNHGHA